MRRVRVGDVLQLQRRAVPIDPATEYRLIGVYSFGKGIFHREPKIGAELGNYKFFAVEPGDLVLSNIQAWEGAIGFATEADRGTVGTHRFLAYTAIDADEIDTNWARYFFLSEAGFPLIQKAAPGSVTRNRTLAVERFEELEIPLPDIDEQRRIAARLDRIVRSASLLGERGHGDSVLSAASLVPAALDHAFRTARAGLCEIDALVDFVSDVVHPGDPLGQAESFVGLQHVESHTGRKLGSSSIGGEKGRKFRFRPGDVVYGYLRPYLNKVWVADSHGLCSVDQYVLRPRADVDPQVLSAALRSGSSLKQAEDLTHNLQLPRLRSGLLKGLVVPDPRSLDQASALASLQEATNRVSALRDLVRQRNAMLDALVPSALNSAFARLA